MARLTRLFTRGRNSKYHNEGLPIRPQSRWNVMAIGLRVTRLAVCQFLREVTMRRSLQRLHLGATCPGHAMRSPAASAACRAAAQSQLLLSAAGEPPLSEHTLGRRLTATAAGSSS